VEYCLTSLVPTTSDKMGLVPFDHPVLHQRKIVDICCGTNFSLMCLDDYSVWGFGNNSRHQLSALSNTERELQKIEGLDGINIVKVRAKGEHSIFISDIGTVYSVGSNDWKNCGYDTMSSVPKQVIFPSDRPDLLPVVISDVQSGYGHTVCLDSEHGVAYSFGGKSFKQLGRSDYDHIVGRVELPNTIQVISIACGAAHCFFICEDMSTMTQEIYACGKNNCGCLANNSTEHTQGPELLDLTQFDPYINKRLISIEAGQNHTAFLTDMYHVFLVGDNSSGQTNYVQSQTILSDVQHINPILPTNDRIITLCCAYNATMLISEGGNSAYIMGSKDFTGCRATSHIITDATSKKSLHVLDNKYLRYDASRQRLRASAGEGPILILIEDLETFTRFFPKFTEATTHPSLFDVTICFR
jgi:alpha-tubulin suppressor-like RCC1 family protein